MPDDINPYGAAAADARKVLTSWRHGLVDFAKRHLTLALVQSVLGTVGAVLLAYIALPVAAAAVCAVVFAALCVHVVYSTRLLKRKDAELHQAWIANYRIRQRHLEHQIATDNVILELMGERPQRHKPFRSVPHELRSALAYVKRKQSDAETRADAAEAKENGTATSPQSRTLAARRRGRTLPAPTGPAVDPIKRRRDARIAKSNTLEAEIQALALPGNMECAKALEEAKRTQRERQDAAMEAQQAARERSRAGLPPTAEEPEAVITLGTRPNGDSDVGRDRRAATPEQIARGEDSGAVGAA